MSTYEQLSETVAKIETQAIIAQMRTNSKMGWQWNVNDYENPTEAIFTWASGNQAMQYKLDWTTGAVTSSLGRGAPPDGTDPSGDFLAMKSKWQGKIAPLFDKFYFLPEPSDYAAESKELDTTGEYLNGGGFSIGDTVFEGANLNYYLWQVGSEKSKLNDWNGAAAVSFRDNFLKTWNSNLSNQFSALCVIKGSIDREEALWEKTRTQIAEIADAALAAMREADGGGSDASVLIAVFGAVAGITSIFVPVVGQVAIGVAVGALSIADAATEKPEEKTIKFGADTPDGVYDKIVDGLDKFDSEVWDAEYAIYSPLRDLQDKLAERSSFLGTGADSLVGSTDPGDIALQGDIIEVGEINNLRIVGDICIKAGADAKTAGNGCSVASPHSTRSRQGLIGFGSDGPADQVANCTTMLQDIILDNALIVTDCGEQLDAAANTYSSTDQDSARRMKDRSSDLDEAREDDGEMPAPPELPPPYRVGPGPTIY